MILFLRMHTSDYLFQMMSVTKFLKLCLLFVTFGALTDDLLYAGSVQGGHYVDISQEAIRYWKVDYT